ncbi:preprotein translocase subunit YajC [Actinoplanes sp. TBRC 11911]|nr:preprotein translocase subunit YajC [Actinoplanes sp. TBRC 11911]NMO51429.1 preprotein translocase subunit YajC [Actinoplanes sp. TBRC 11911]
MVPEAAASSGGGSFTPLLLIVLLFVVMYFLMIRPQQKRRREAMQMQNTLGPGDRVQTIGGMQATVVAIDDDVVTLEIAPGVHAQFARPAIARVTQQNAASVPDPEPLVDEPPAAPAEHLNNTVDTPAEEPLSDPTAEPRKKD